MLINMKCSIKTASNIVIMFCNIKTISLFSVKTSMLITMRIMSFNVTKINLFLYQHDSIIITFFCFREKAYAKIYKHLYLILYIDCYLNCIVHVKLLLTSLLITLNDMK